MKDLLPFVADYSSRYPKLNQIVFYPVITPESLNLIYEDFPEFDKSRETPILFYQDADNYYSMPKWIMITNHRIYYSMYYLPYRFRILNYYSLSKIAKFRIVLRYRPLDSYVEINNKKVFSIVFKNKKEASILSDFINRLLEQVEEEIDDNLVKCYIDKSLENAELFEIADSFFNEVNIAGRAWGFECFYYSRFIPGDDLIKAQQDYADFDITKEQAIIYLDNSWVGNFTVTGDSGLVITNKYLYYKLQAIGGRKGFTVGKIPLENIKSFHIKVRYLTRLVINHGQKEFYLRYFTIFQKRDSKALEQLMERFINYFK